LEGTSSKREVSLVHEYEASWQRSMDIEQIAGHPNGCRRINSCERKVGTQGSTNKLEM
jgi:hypothetical protein